MTAIYGHRGARGEQPENTLAAFRHAASLDLAGIECDVALTRDFVPVLHHDPDLPGGRLIRDLSFAELHLLAPDIPTLAQALRAAPDLEWLIEIKTFPGARDQSHAPEVVAAAVAAVLADAGKTLACILAFDWRVLSAMAICAPQLRRVCLTAPETEQSRELWWGDAVTTAATPAAVAQTGAHGWAPAHATLTAEQAVQAHRLGLRVFPWTVNTAADFQRLAPVADGIITDYPALFSQENRSRR